MSHIEHSARSVTTPPVCHKTPVLPVRAPHNLAMAAAVRVWQAGRKWVTDDPVILRQLADGLRSLPTGYPTAHCRSGDPIRGYAHAHQVMDVHAAHRCQRYEAAAAYASEVR